MSVVYQQRAARRRWLTLWPLAVFLLLATGGGLWLWQAWPQVMMHSVVWQRDVNQQMSGLLKAVAANPTRAGGSLLLFSFIYGVLHALGPGHGKIVITTWLATHPSKLKSSIGLTLASSLLQGLVAIGLVVVVLTVLQLPARQLHMSSFWLEKGSYALVGMLGVLLCVRALKKLRQLLMRPKFTAFTPHHVHHEGCGCGHEHEAVKHGDVFHTGLQCTHTLEGRHDLCSTDIHIRRELLHRPDAARSGWDLNDCGFPCDLQNRFRIPHDPVIVIGGGLDEELAATGSRP